jgi:hypothetical protein
MIVVAPQRDRMAPSGLQDPLRPAGPPPPNARYALEPIMILNVHLGEEGRGQAQEGRKRSRPDLSTEAL